MEDERRGHKNQIVSKRLKAGQMCVDDENEVSKKSPLLIAQDTQHKLGVAFSYLERNNTGQKDKAFFTKKKTLLLSYPDLLET